jgi:thiamine-monophosphate kinase
MTGPITSEDDLIARYLRPLAADFPGAFDLSDDCAVLDPPPGERLVLSVDAVAAGVHFLADDGAADIAWKALAVNVSDLAAKGAKPIAYLMSLAFPETPQPAWMEQFAAGLRQAQDGFGLALAGGDTDRRPGPLSITITAIGSTPGRTPARQDAHSGDELYVSGTLGDAALGLKLRRDPGLAAAWGLSEAEAASLVARYLRPQPRLELRDALRRCAAAALDISDGLAKDLDRLCRASHLGAAVEVAQVPLSPAVAKAVGADPGLLTSVLTGGDDYEILAAVPATLAADFCAAAAAGGRDVTRIGALDGGSSVLLSGTGGHAISLPRSGWDHFA